MSRGKICVSRKILADVGRGIYRSPASAIKELVSNSFDAGAGWVRITTNAPYFDIFTCEDNGAGMTPKEFQHILHRIGSSSKRSKKTEYVVRAHARRPVIGKIGIGLLAVSQICDKFAVVSKRKGDRDSFEATIDLAQFESDDAYLEGEGEITLGEYDISTSEVPDDDIPISYTKIVMTSLREGFRQRLKEEHRLQIARPKKSPADGRGFEEFAAALAENKDFKSLAEYDRMLWELGLLSPVGYVNSDKAVFPTPDQLRADFRRLESFDFRLLFDGMEVRKPILFYRSKNIGRKGIDFKVYRLPTFSQVIANERLRFHGYLYSQRVKIRPTELQGVLVRIRDVGIGAYDKSLLHYPREEGPIFSMLSGEVFVERGLEGALNIDRNSFNETHPHYLKLQHELHRFVKEHVVNDIRARSKARRAKEAGEGLTRFISQLATETKSEWAFGLRFRVARQSKRQSAPFRYDRSSRTVSLYLKNRGWAKTEKERLVQIRAVAAHVLMLELAPRVQPERILTKLFFGTS